VRTWHVSRVAIGCAAVLLPEVVPRVFALMLVWRLYVSS